MEPKNFPRLSNEALELLKLIDGYAEPDPVDIRPYVLQDFGPAVVAAAICWGMPPEKVVVGSI